MKKKILPLVILAITAVFLLSSCDAMLESIYPNQTGGHNTISITVNAQAAYGYNELYVYLYKSDGTYVTSLATWPDYYSAGYYYSTLDFKDLKDDTYYIEAWSGGYYAYSSYYAVSGANTYNVSMYF
jgi:hypothetical protein